MKPKLNILSYEMGTDAKKMARRQDTAVVHSVFTNAINFKVSGEFCTIINDKLPNTPYTIKVVDYFFDELADSSYIYFGKKSLKIDNKLEIDFEKAKEWTPKAKMNTIDINVEPNIILNSILEHGKPGGFKPLLDIFEEKSVSDNVYSRKARGYVNTFLHNITNDVIDNSLKRLIGLGVGLTPSGDDLLCGLFASLGLFKLPPYARNYTNQMKKDIVRSAFSNTNDISIASLGHYSEGKIDETLDQFFLALHDGAKDLVYDEIMKISNFGHTSGTDLLVGVLLAMKIMEEMSW